MKRFAQIYPLVIIVLSYLIGWYLSPRLPYLMASHWSVKGEVNGYMSKNMGIYFIPTISLVMYFLFRFLPSVDPYKKNFTQFENYYRGFIIIIFSFFFYLYLLTLYWNLGFRVNLIRVLSPAFAALFYYAGILTQKAHRNWFVGIRTPWTMSSDIVWRKTHDLGGKLFKITAVLSLFGVIFPDFALYLLMVPVLITTTTVFIYSYWEYQKLGLHD